MELRAKFGWASLTAGAVLLALVGSAKAQSGPPGPPPPPPGGFHGRGPGPVGPDEAMGFLGFESRFGGKTVTGAPFSADFSTVTTESLPGGNEINRTTNGKIARDSSGRTRSEITLQGFGGFAESGSGGTPPHGTFITDPVAGYSYILNDNQKTARQMKLRTNEFQPNGGTRPNARSGNSANVTTKDLGTQTISGIPAQCTETVRTIPAGQIGNVKAIEVSVERCYSSDLQMNVLIKRSDPRGGTTTYQLADVVRSEPDATLFQVPSDYTISQGGGPGGRRGMRRGADAPPPPQQ